MRVFADSSALVKLYVPESGSPEIAALGAVVVSALARVEVPAALWRKARAERLDPHRARTLVEHFEADLHDNVRFGVVRLDDELLGDAAMLLARHPLRAYDAVQLASALAARDLGPGIDTFACFDRALNVAAAREGFMLVDGG